MEHVIFFPLPVNKQFHVTVTFTDAVVIFYNRINKMYCVNICKENKSFRILMLTTVCTQSLFYMLTTIHTTVRTNTTWEACYHHGKHIRSFSVSWLITGFVPTLTLTEATRRESLVEQKPLTIPEHLSSHLVFSEVCIAQSLVFGVVVCDSSFSLLAIVLSDCVGL